MMRSKRKRLWRELYPDGLSFSRASTAVEAYDAGGRRGATNITKGGTFAQGLTGWTNFLGTHVNNFGLSDINSVRFSPVNQAPYVQQDVICDQTHKFYVSAACFIESHVSGTLNVISARDYGLTSNPVGANADTTKVGQWQLVSAIVTGRAGPGMRVYIGCSNALYTGTFYVDDVRIVDLTAEFGTSSEPTKAYCDADYGAYWEGIRLDTRRKSLIVPPHVFRRAPADNGIGVMIEEGTTNIGGTTYENISGGVSTCVLETSGQYAGWYKVTATYAGTYGWISRLTPLVALLSGEAATFGVDLVTPSGNIVVALGGTTSGGLFTKAGDRYTKTFTAPSNGNWYAVFGTSVVNAAIAETFYWRMHQVEKKPYATTHTPPGTTRQPEAVRVPTYVKATAGNETNLLTEAMSNAESSVSLVNIGSATITRSTEWKAEGSYSYKIVGADSQGSNYGGMSNTLSLPVGSIVVLHGLVHNPNASDISVALSFAGGGANPTVVPAGATKKVVTTAYTLVANPGNFRFTEVTGQTFYIDCLQVELNRAGSWVPGGMKRLLDATGGEIEVECMITDMVKRQIAGVFPYLLMLRNIQGQNSTTFYHRDASASFSINVAAAGATFADSLVQNGLRKLTVFFAAGGCGVKADGVNVANFAPVTLPDGFAQHLRLGSTDSSTLYANTIFTAVRFRDYQGNLTREWDLSGPQLRYQVGEGGISNGI